MCSQVFFTIINTFSVAIDPANEQTELIAIDQPNSITFRVALGSPDWQTKLISFPVS